LTWIFLVIAYLFLFGLWKFFNRRAHPRPPGLASNRRRRPNLLRTPYVPALYFIAFLLAGFIQSPTSADFYTPIGLLVAYALGYLAWTYRVTLRPTVPRA
jgi:hypothetical protein